MTFIANLSKLMERGILDIDGPVSRSRSCPSLDVPIGDLHHINERRLEQGEDGWLEECGRTLFGETEYIAFTKDQISLSPGHVLYIAPRSSLARVGLQVSRFEDDHLSKIIGPRKLPEYKGRIPLVVRTMRTNLILPEDLPVVQLFVAGENTSSMNTDQLTEACRNRQIEVLTKNGESVEPKNGEFSLTFHPLIKKYLPSTRVLIPQENTESYFQTFDMSRFPEGFDILESCFYLSSTAETVSIGNRFLGMLTQSYPRKWRRFFFKDRNGQKVIGEYVWRYSGREEVEELVEPAGYVHLTPWINPGSRGNQTLEIAAKVYSHNRVIIRVGDYACSLNVYELDEEAEPSNRYKEQVGPCVSFLYKDVCSTA